jgi:signal transduction histidine kinase
MLFKNKFNAWRDKLKESLKTVVIIFVTVSLTATALLLANSFSEQRNKNLLTIEALKYQSLLVRQIASDEEQLMSFMRALIDKSPQAYKYLLDQVFLNNKRFFRVEIRDTKGNLLLSRSAPGYEKIWPVDTRIELPPSVVMNFFKAVEQQKIYWSISYSPTGQSGVELVIPAVSSKLVLVAHISTHHFLPPESGIPIGKDIRVEFETSVPENLLSNNALALPLDLNGLNTHLIYSLTTFNKSVPNYSFFLVSLLGISLCVLVISYSNETKKNRLMQVRLSEQEMTLAKQAQLSTLGEISTTLAHELNQPLATITNYIATCEIRLQQLGFQDNVLNKALNDARGQTLRAGEVVQSIRNYLKKGSVVKATVEVEEAILRLQPIINALTKEKRSTLKIELTPHIAIRIDPALFEQIVLNLCKNALDAMSEIAPAKRQLLIRSSSDLDERSKKWARIDVVDNGHGISEENSKKLFEAFFTTKSEGMGIGLSLSRSVTESHGGKIMWTNNADGGATFSIILPLHSTD